MQDEKRLHRCCFTGHRPEKLNISEQEAKKRLEIAVENAISDGFTTFISGMARGIDMWAAEIVIKARKKDRRIKLICAVPFRDFEQMWSARDKNLYRRILTDSDLVVFVSQAYSKACFQTRNRYMVDNSARIIAAFSGEAGGTKNTVEYAMLKKLEIVNIIDEK